MPSTRSQALGPVHTATSATGSASAVRTASWAVYDDANHTTYSAAGYATSDADSKWDLFTLVNPISVETTNADGQVTADIQAVLGVVGSSVGWVESSSPTSSEVSLASGQSPAALFLGPSGIGAPPQSSYTAWTAYGYSHKQLVSTNVYYDIPSTGTSGVNYNQTSYGYDTLGRHVWTKSPAGTITWNVVSRGLVTSTWVDTSDGSPPAYNGGNMVDVARLPVRRRRRLHAIDRLSILRGGEHLARLDPHGPRHANVL